VPCLERTKGAARKAHAESERDTDRHGWRKRSAPPASRGAKVPALSQQSRRKPAVLIGNECPRCAFPRGRKRNDRRGARLNCRPSSPIQGDSLCSGRSVAPARVDWTLSLAPRSHPARCSSQACRLGRVPGYTRASARTGPPEAVRCFGPPIMIVAPAGGTVARLARFSMPYLPAGSTVRCVLKSADAP